MFDPEKDLAELHPQRVPDRPERPRPQEISHKPGQPWLSSTSKRKQKKPRDTVKQKVDYAVRIALPIIGIAILVIIGLRIAAIIAGVYS